MQTPTSRPNAGTQHTIEVVATTGEGTEAALRIAVPLGIGLGARIRIVVPRIVPDPDDLESSAESSELFVKRYGDMVRRLGGAADIDLCLCRTLDEVIEAVAARAARTVVVGGPTGRWITSPEERFASALARRGVRVIFASSGPNRTQRRTFASAAMIVLAGACLIGV